MSKSTLSVMASVLMTVVIAVGSVDFSRDARAAAQDKSLSEGDIKTKLAEFKKLIGDAKGAKDVAAIAILDELLKVYPKMKPADQNRFIKGVNACLAKRKIKRESGKGKAELFRRAVRALGSVGPKASKALRTAYEGKTNRKFKGREWDSLKGEMLEQLGVSKDPRNVDLLLEVARRADSDLLRRKAGGSLRHYDKAKLKQRKEICKQLIREWINIDSNARGTTDPNLAQQRARSEQRLAGVSGTWNVTLKRLTGQKFKSPQEWQNFYNGSMWKKNWDKTAVSSTGKKNSRGKKRR